MPHYKTNLPGRSTGTNDRLGEGVDLNHGLFIEFLGKADVRDWPPQSSSEAVASPLHEILAALEREGESSPRTLKGRTFSNFLQSPVIGRFTRIGS